MAINADINAARNIARKLGYKILMPRKILSFYITSKGLRPLTPKRGNDRDPTVKPAHKGGEGVIFFPYRPREWCFPISNSPASSFNLAGILPSQGHYYFVTGFTIPLASISKI